MTMRLSITCLPEKATTLDANTLKRYTYFANDQKILSLGIPDWQSFGKLEKK